jgi:hypothetical protein
MSSKHDTANPSKLASFLRKSAPVASAKAGADLPGGADLVDLFVHSYLLWQAPSADAGQALKRLKAAFFDWNDMRVSLTSDIVDVIGAKYWRAADRVSRMRDAMNGIYRREHKVCLDRLRTLMKKDAVNYMDTLPGMVPFVAQRVLLVGVDFHAVPVDEFGLQLLVQAGALPAGTSLADAQGWVTRHVKAEESRDAHRAMVAAVDHMWATNPPKLPKSASKPSELAPPKPVEEARAAARALVEAQLAAERAALMAERAARREEMRREKAALKAKQARDASRSARKPAATASKGAKRPAAKAAARKK